jgi:hypothetical protein
MITINIKPLSVNEAWQGKRFKTPALKRYTRDVFLLLPKLESIPTGKLRFDYKFYLSNAGADYDNPIKPIQDIICAKYKHLGLNDNQIYFSTIEKILVKKGQEKIEFKISSYQ